MVILSNHNKNTKYVPLFLEKLTLCYFCMVLTVCVPFCFVFLVTLSLPLTQCSNPARIKELETRAHEVVYSTLIKTIPHPPPPPPVTRVIIPDNDDLKDSANSVLSALLLKTQLKEAVGKIEKVRPIERRSVSPPLPPLPSEVIETFPATPEEPETAPAIEAVVVRMRNSQKQKSQSANDRRSYVEKTTLPNNETSVKRWDEDVKEEQQVNEEGQKSCGKAQKIANDLINGKHPICCVCDIKINRYLR